MTDTQASRQPDPRAVRRGRFTALLLFSIAFLPVILATAMYFGGWGTTGASANKGELLQPVGAVSTFGFSGPEGQPLADRFVPVADEARWLVLMLAEHCGQACESALHETRQVHIALGRDDGRVERAIWAPELSPEQLSRYPALMRLQLPADKALPAELPGAADLAESYQIYVVDPHGNVILRYDNTNSGEDLLDDLEKLLRVSSIG